MKADKTVVSEHRFTHLVGDAGELLLRFDLSAFIGVYRRLNCGF
jgi:hypothetical protein